MLQGAPIVSGPANVESYREAVANGELLTASHDGYLARFGLIHRRVLMMAHDGSRLDGEDTLGARARRPHQGRRRPITHCVFICIRRSRRAASATRTA